VEDDPINQVRSLIETDLSYPWMAAEVAAHFAMSEATMRRWLSKTGQGFARILLYTRLEWGLSLLQTTDAQVSQIALDCGFKTPSHFSDAFRKRFGIKPKDIRLAAG
jgi:transcriptional regulator GlxA family with amidase domain